MLPTLLGQNQSQHDLWWEFPAREVRSRFAKATGRRSLQRLKRPGVPWNCTTYQPIQARQSVAADHPKVVAGWIG
jgi:hypothetical protein